jgi:FkbM family methyltransferase
MIQHGNLCKLQTYQNCMERKNDSFLGNVVRGVQGRLKGLSAGNHKKAGLNWYKVKYLKHLPSGKEQVYHFADHKIYFKNGPELLHSLKEIFVDEIYNIQFHKPDPYIIDCGANIGLSVLYQLSRYPGARIIAFEPDRNNFVHLEQNIRPKGSSKVSLLNEAVWKEDTILHFLAEGNMGSKISQEITQNSTIEVKAARLKNLLVEKIDFLKLDIEGAEYEVIKDCTDNLHMADHLFVEFHGYFTRMNELNEILQIIEKNGFAFYIREADTVYPTPFSRGSKKPQYDLQLNIFCFKTPK